MQIKSQQHKIVYAPAWMHKHISISMLDFNLNKISLFTNLNAHKNT